MTRFFELLVMLAVVGIVLRNPGNFSTAMSGLTKTYTSFVKGLQPVGSWR